MTLPAKFPLFTLSIAREPVPRTVPAYQGNTFGELLDANILVTGGYKTSAPERADLIIAVGMPLNGVTLEAAVPENTEALTAGSQGFC